MSKRLFELLCKRVASKLANRMEYGGGRAFLLPSSDNYGVVDLQLDPKQSNSGLARCTVNVGILSAVLLEFFDGFDFCAPKKIPPPNTDQCVFRTRLGNLMPQKRDTWWDITSDNLNEEGDAISNAILTYALPYITSNVEDSSLVEVWTNSFNHTNGAAIGHQQLRFLAALLCTTAQTEKLREVIGALRANWAKKPMMIDLESFCDNLLTHGLKVKPRLSPAGLENRKAVEKSEAKRTERLAAKRTKKGVAGT